MNAPLLLGGALVALFLLSRQKTTGTPLADRLASSSSGTAPPRRPTTSLVPAASGTGGVAGLLGSVYKGLDYGSKLYNYGSKLFTALVPTEAAEVGTVTGDVLGTGALTTTAPDILLPVGESAASIGGAEVGAAAGLAAEGGASAAGVAGVGLTGVGTGAAAGTSIVAGTEVATIAGTSVLGTAAIGAGWLGVGVIAEVLINLGLDEYEPGSISRAIMVAKQEAIRSQGNAAVQAAIQSAPGFAAAILAIQTAPGQGQVQYGVGAEYAGVNDAPGSVTKGWPALVAMLSDPRTLREHPELIAEFIANLWVQTGESGAAAFDADNTLAYRALLLSKLPYTPAWNGVRQQILNARIVDPRNMAERDLAYAEVPELPADGYLRVGNARIPTAGVWTWYNVWHTPPDTEASFAEHAALELAGSSPAIVSKQNTTLLMYNGRLISLPIEGDVSEYHEGTSELGGGYTTTQRGVTGYHTDPQFFDLNQACARPIIVPPAPVAGAEVPTLGY